MKKKPAKITGVQVPESTFVMNQWRLLPSVSYWTGSGESEHSVNIIRVEGGEFMVLVVKGTLKNHRHATQKFPKTVLEATKVAEGLIGTGGRWLLSSFLEYGAEDRDLALIASIHALGGDVTLSVIATPLSRLRSAKSSARDKVNAVLGNHAHDLTVHKSIHAAVRATPAALRRVAKTARCECTEIHEKKKRKS